MAEHMTVETVDDLDGSSDAVQVRFALDGREYTIDLSDENRQRLADVLAPFIAVARKGRRGSSRAHALVSTRRDPAETRAIREWGRANGWDVADFGRVPVDVEHAYRKRGAAA